MAMLGTIEKRHGFIGLAASPSVFYPFGGSSGVAHDFRESFGETGDHDLGKQLHRVHGVLQMESEPQMRERLRRDAFRWSPLLQGFLSTLLEDLQNNISDGAFGDIDNQANCGTIFDCPAATLAAAKSYCDLFYQDGLAGAACAQSHCTYEQLGSDLYMEMCGHGVGFSDRDHADDKQESDDIAAILRDRRIALGLTYLETYCSDVDEDGDVKAFICGKETL